MIRDRSLALNSPLKHWVSDEDEARVTAQARLDKSVAGMRAAGLNAEGEIGDADPIQAIEDAGLKPGKDIIIVSIDAVREGVQAVVDGKINCVVECNPLFGPKVYDTIARVLAGEKVERKAFNKVIAADPNRADAYYWKGVNMIGKATLQGDKMVAPPGTAEAFQKYLELQPTGTYADAAKQMLNSIGSSIETSYGMKKAAKK